MKSTKNVDRFDYSKYESVSTLDHDTLGEYQFWGIHPKDGRLRIDTKRYKKMCEWIGITDFMPDGLFKPRNTVYFLPEKKGRYDYKVNMFNDLVDALIHDWEYEYKPLFKAIKTPSEVEDQSRLSGLAYTSCSDDYDEICIEAKLDGFRRIESYNRIINSLYCQFILKIGAEVDRYTLMVMTDLGYKGTDYDFKSFCKFSDGLLKNKEGTPLKDLSKFNAYNMLHKICNFLKHNSRESYLTLKRLYPQNVRTDAEYKNGMFAGDWIIIKDGYIDKTLKQIKKFFEDYCKVYIGENVEEANWNYDNYFKDAVNQMKYPFEYWGIY